MSSSGDEIHMSVKTYRIKGSFRRNKKVQSFIKEMKAVKEEEVIELLLSTVGSQYHVKRYEIKIEQVEEITE